MHAMTYRGAKVVTRSGGAWLSPTADLNPQRFRSFTTGSKSLAAARVTNSLGPRGTATGRTPTFRPRASGNPRGPFLYGYRNQLLDDVKGSTFAPAFSSSR